MEKLSYSEVALLCQQLTMILESGLSLSNALIEVSTEVDNPSYANALTKCAHDMDNGDTLSDAFNQTHLFDDYMIEMIRIGEESGYLDKVLHQLSVYYYRLDTTQAKIKDALTYPSILIVMTCCVVGLLLFKVVPIFNQILASVGITLSPLANSLMSLANGLSKYSLVFVAIIVVFIGAVVIKNKRGGLLTKALKYDLSVTQFAFALSLYLQSGFDINRAIESIIPMIENKTLLAKVNELHQLCEDDIPFEQAIANVKIFKGMYNRMLVIGFKSGKWDEAMANVATYYENDIDHSINKMLDIIEPSLVALLALVVGIILLAIMLPLTSIMVNL